MPRPMLAPARTVAVLLVAGCAGGPGAVAPPPAAASPPTFLDLLAASGVRVDRAGGAVEVAGWVNMNDGAVEVFACAPGGKTHESVVVLDCLPRALHAGLVAIGLRPGAPAQPGPAGSCTPPSGDRVAVSVRWRDADGKEHRASATEWLWNPPRGAAARIGAFVFTGSSVQTTPDGATYAADASKTLVSTYHDASSVLESPASDANDDEAYAANVMAMPPVGTPIIATFARAAAEARDG